MYRGFSLNQPSKGDGTQLLHNKPCKNNNFDPTILPPIPQPPSEVIRAPPPATSNTGSNSRKRTPKASTEKVGESAGSSVNASPATSARNKKKLSDATIPDAASATTATNGAAGHAGQTTAASKKEQAVKQFLKQAQNQGKLLQHGLSGNMPTNAAASGAATNNSSAAPTPGMNLRTC